MTMTADQITRRIHAALHPEGDPPCESACTCVIAPGWTALGLAAALGRHAARLLEPTSAVEAAAEAMWRQDGSAERYAEEWAAEDRGVREWYRGMAAVALRAAGERYASPSGSC